MAARSISVCVSGPMLADASKLPSLRAAGWALIALLGCVLGLQLVLASGVRLTGASWGGRLDQDPGTLRIAAGFACAVLAFGICVVLEKMQYVRLIRRPRVVDGILVFFTVYWLLNSGANVMSPGTIERFVMTPIALLACILTEL